MTLLVAGATGFLGTAVLRALDEPVVAVVRGSDYAGRAATMARRTGREVCGLPGDVRRPRWGLSAQDVAALRGEVRAVVNLAGDIAWSAPWDRLAEVNIDGARHGADLARELDVPLLHASSLYAGYDYGDEVAEVLLDERGHLTKYERSKLRGEWTVAQACLRSDLRAVIARIPALSGDLDPPPTGRSGSSRVPLSRLIMSGFWRVMPYSPGARLDICPRDLVARRLVEQLDRAQAEPVVVRHLGQAAAAPLIAAIAREVRLASRHDPGSFPRPVPVPAGWLKRVSQQADRLGESARNTALIGARYFASGTVFTSTGLGPEISLRTLVRTLGMPHRAEPVRLNSYYAGWPS